MRFWSRQQSSHSKARANLKQVIIASFAVSKPIAESGQKTNLELARYDFAMPADTGG
jgi:hypothetical protein